MEKSKVKRNNRQLGTYYEQLAKNYLIEKGYTIRQMNYRIRTGEIDIIAKDETYTVFIEIKYRKHIRCGYPRESVNYHKQHKLIQVATHYLMTYHLYDTPVRFDVIEILDEQITHIQNAFMKG